MKILVADDDEAMRDLVEAVLTSAGHSVVTAADGLAAWAAFEREAPELLVLDWQMPGLSGVDLCEKVRRSSTGQHTFILMATARGATDDLRRVLAAGADDYLSKPLTPETLATRITIAERHMAVDLERRQAVDALQRAQWLAGIGETAIAIQHEVNNPLTALLGNVALLEDNTMTAEERAQCLRTIAEQAVRIGAVVRRLSNLRDPRSVEYIRGSRMIDLSEKS
ncbi:MAG TPA: response regulator [Gemmatimonadaceae bacterium]|jgi:DNA-binding response OmpR family regulator|nr:response regulator [Gemmatimonadaceae bacterium]